MPLAEKPSLTHLIKEYSQQLQHLAFIVESSDDAIIGATEDIITSWNAAAEKLYGYTAAEIIGQPLWVLAPAEEKEHFLQSIEKIKKGESLGHFETKRIKKDGTIFNASLTLSLIKDDQGKTIGTSGIIRDITAREKAIEKLRLSEERFSKAFNCSPNLVFIKSLREKKIIDVNKSWCQHTGYQKEEITGKTTAKFHLVANGKTQAASEDILNQPPITNLKISYRTKEGELRTGLLSTEIINIHEENCLLGMLADTTELDRVDKEMKRLGQMAAGIGHEIRNPMTTVRGFLQLFLNKEENPEHKKILKLMIEELDRADSIITEFLSLAKNKPRALKKQNLKTIIKKIMPLIAADSKKSKHPVNFTLKDVPDLLLNENEIRQIMYNLVHNGFDAMEDAQKNALDKGQEYNGALTISTYTEDNAVILAIRDEGTGIKPEIIDHISAPFFTTKAKGTGLGLAVCYNIAAKHKAQIQIDTSERGTTFFIKFGLPIPAKTI